MGRYFYKHRPYLFPLPFCKNQAERQEQMQLKIRYDWRVQTIELDTEETEKLWVSLSLEGEDLSQEEREKKIQDAFDIEFNEEERKNWRRSSRHKGYTKALFGKDGCGDENGPDSFEPLMDEVLDDRIFRKYEIEQIEKETYESLCEWIRKVLIKKPEWAEAFIAVHLDGETIRAYSARMGVDENNITQKLKRAKKKLRENYQNRQI